MKSLVLFSGGLDSTVVLYEAVKKYDCVRAITFLHGAKSTSKEIELCRYHCNHLGIELVEINLDFINDLYKSDLLINGEVESHGNFIKGDLKCPVVPFRNGVFFSIAAGYAASIDYDVVLSGIHEFDFADCTSEFRDAMNQAIKIGTYNAVSIENPLQDLKKGQIMNKGLDLGVDFDKTWSCYKALDYHCGRCISCKGRMAAYQLAKIVDTTVYLNKK